MTVNDRRPAPRATCGSPCSTTSTATAWRPRQRDIPAEPEGRRPAARRARPRRPTPRATTYTSRAQGRPTPSTARGCPSPYPATPGAGQRRLALRPRHARPAQRRQRRDDRRARATPRSARSCTPTRPRWSSRRCAPRSVYADNTDLPVDACRPGSCNLAKSVTERGAEPVREGGHPAALVPRGRRLLVLHRDRLRQRPRPARAVPRHRRGQPAGLLRAVRRPRWR